MNYEYDTCITMKLKLNLGGIDKLK